MNQKKIFIAAIIPFTVCVFACSNNGELRGDHVYKNDFENIDGWIQNSQLEKGDAHSGDFCCKVTPENPFSLTFNKKIGDLSLSKIEKINLTAWVKFSDLNSKAKLVITIDSADGSPAFFWMGIPAEDFITEADKWFQVTNEVTLPQTLKKDYKLLVYLWNTGKPPVYIDDLSFQLIN